MARDDRRPWEFTTARLQVSDWRRQGDDLLGRFLLSALTATVTRDLPASWQSPLTLASVPDWIAERDQEGSLFLVQSLDDQRPLGLFMFFRSAGGTTAEVRLGYVLAEEAWGHGYATEQLRGFIEVWDARAEGAQLRAVVARANQASRRVLEKNGFAPDSERDELIEYRRVARRDI